jgi:hypothetical protein
MAAEMQLSQAAWLGLAASGFWRVLAPWPLTSASRASPAAAKISGPAVQSTGDGSAQGDHPSSLQAGGAEQVV